MTPPDKTIEVVVGEMRERRADKAVPAFVVTDWADRITRALAEGREAVAFGWWIDRADNNPNEFVLGPLTDATYMDEGDEATPLFAHPAPALTAGDAAAVAALWRLLDDIDTLGDACKGNDAEFRRRAYAIQRKRFDILGGLQFDALVRRLAPGVTG